MQKKFLKFFLLLALLSMIGEAMRRKRCKLRKRPRARPGTRPICNPSTGKWEKNGISAFALVDNNLQCPDSAKLNGTDPGDEVIKSVESWPDCGTICYNSQDCLHWTWDRTTENCFLWSSPNVEVFPAEKSFLSGTKGCTSDREDFECGDGWQEWNSSCYTVMTDHKDINKCRQECEEWSDGHNNAHLASVHSEEENRLVEQMVGDLPVRKGGHRLTWLGGFIREVGGDFSWEDGTNWDYENWDTEAGEPSRKRPEKRLSHECIYLGWDTVPPLLGKWSDGACNSTFSVFDCVCKI